MAKGKVKKGFASYLLVLFLAVIATFLIIIAVMLFSPFKNILGFQYFTYKFDEKVTHATAETENEVFNFQTLNELNINCDYANVKVERYYNVDTPAIRFENTMSGFARSDHDTEFKYEIYYNDASKTELNIDVHEPEGFLFFSKNLTISILIPTSLSYTLENTDLNIINNTGNVYIGNNIKAINLDGEDFRNYITIGNLNVKTNKGKTLIRTYTNENFNSLVIKTEKGKIESQIDLNIAENLEIYSSKGEIEFKKLVVAKSDAVTLNLKNSEFYTPYLKANVNLTIKEGYFDVDYLSGSLISNDAVEQMSTATLTIKEFDGYMSLPYANKSKVNLGKVSASSQIYIHATEGDIKIDEMNGNVAKLETTKGDINVETNGTDIDVKTTSGNIKIKYNDLNDGNQIDIESNSGDVDFKVGATKRMDLKVLNNKGEYRTDGYVKISGLDVMPESEVHINGGGQKVVIATNGSVNVELI